MLLSFIIPVYNAEQYLAQCLDSILQQPIDSFEIILIDDCSEDASGKICDQYKQQYSYIKVFHLKENVGPGEARNVGIRNAEGQYVHFIDADDILSENRYTMIIDEIKETNADVIYFEYHFLRMKNNELCIYEPNHLQYKSGVYSSDEFCEIRLRNEDVVGYIWRIVVKKTLLLNNSIYFPSYACGEDAVVFLKLILAANNVSILSEKIYCHRENAQGSITNDSFKNSRKLAVGSLLTVCEMLQFKATSNAQEKYRFKMINFYFHDMLRCYFGSNERKEIERKIQKYLEEYNADLARLANENTVYAFIQQYGAMHGVEAYYRFFVDRLLYMTMHFKKKYLFVFPASKQNLSIALFVRNCGGDIYGFLDNNELLAGEGRENWRIFSPRLLQRIIDAGDMEQISVVICSSKDTVTQALERQLEALGLKEQEHFISLK